MLLKISRILFQGALLCCCQSPCFLGFQSNPGQNMNIDPLICSIISTVTSLSTILFISLSLALMVRLCILEKCTPFLQVDADCARALDSVNRVGWIFVPTLLLARCPFGGRRKAQPSKYWLLWNLLQNISIQVFPHFLIFYSCQCASSSPKHAHTYNLVKCRKVTTHLHRNKQLFRQMPISVYRQPRKIVLLLLHRALILPPSQRLEDSEKYILALWVFVWSS